MKGAGGGVVVEQEDEELVVQRACRRRATAPALRLQQRPDGLHVCGDKGAREHDGELQQQVEQS